MTLDMFAGARHRSAAISDCGCYRYRLERRWDRTLPVVLWIMLNPSTADADTDDATVCKIAAYSKRRGFGGLVIVNLFAWRSRDPGGLLTATNPVGSPAADEHIRAALAECETVICGWGDSGPRGITPRRVAQVLAMIEAAGRKPLALGTTKSGSPRHPLYVPGNADPVPWPGRVTGMAGACGT